MDPEHADIPLHNFGAGPRMCVGTNLAEEEVYPASFCFILCDFLLELRVTILRYAACALLCLRYKWQFENPQLHKDFDYGGLSRLLLVNWLTLFQ